MTNEECIGLLKRYAEYNGMGIPNLAGCREAMRMAAELLERPSLPSNLDEAAEFDKMFEDFCDQHPDGLTLNECAEFFYDKGKQAGAEWMAEQGVMVDGEICIPNAFREPKEGAELVARAELSKESGFKFGDKVRVQITKI